MATIDDVARAAGVSASTVSYALSGKRPISAPTKAKVEQAIRELGFQPHAGARALASARTNVLALMVPFRPGINVPIIMDFVGGVVTAARTFEHDVLLLTQDDPAGMSRVVGTSLADALIVMDIESHDPRLETLRELRQPAVLIGVPADPGGLSCVDLDFAAAGRLAARRLLGLGHHELALIGASRERFERLANYAVRMRDGIQAAAEEEGASFALVPSEPTFAGGAAALDQLIEEHPGVTGLIVHNEAALPGVMDALARRGLAVPDQRSVIAVSAVDIAESLPRPVTSIEVPGYDIGRIAVEMVMAHLDGDHLAQTRLVTPALTDRGSTAPPPADPRR